MPSIQGPPANDGLRGPHRSHGGGLVGGRGGGRLLRPPCTTPRPIEGGVGGRRGLSSARDTCISLSDGETSGVCWPRRPELARRKREREASQPSLPRGSGSDRLLVRSQGDLRRRVGRSRPVDRVDPLGGGEAGEARFRAGEEVCWRVVLLNDAVAGGGGKEIQGQGVGQSVGRTAIGVGPRSDSLEKEDPIVFDDAR